jgi:hypothetical protein
VYNILLRIPQVVAQDINKAPREMAEWRKMAIFQKEMKNECHFKMTILACFPTVMRRPISIVSSHSRVSERFNCNFTVKVRTI